MINFGAFSNKDRTEFTLLMKDTETQVALRYDISRAQMIELYKNFGDVLLGIDTPINNEMIEE